MPEVTTAKKQSYHDASHNRYFVAPNGGMFCVFRERYGSTQQAEVWAEPPLEPCDEFIEMQVKLDEYAKLWGLLI